VTMTMTPPVAIPSVSSLRAAAFGVLGSDAWRDRGVEVAVPTYMRTKSAFLPIALNHNSILTTVAVAPASAVRDGSAAAKQAGPPRGVPR
jgi:hypothetical protein